LGVLSVTGATGFLGRHLLNAAAVGTLELRALVREDPAARARKVGVKYVPGDLLNPESLPPLLSRGGTAVHLAFLPGPPEANLAAARHLASACVEAGVRRLVHCSTAVVVGRVGTPVVREGTPCRPQTDYERTKLAIEEVLLEASQGRFEVTVLRPTAVFGPGGANLLAVAADLVRNRKLANYLKRSLYGQRRMNLVSVHNVVAALCFLAARPAGVDREIFIISDDDDPTNNYADVERKLRRLLGLPTERVPPLPFVARLLPLLLRLRGRSNVDPHAAYSCEKLRLTGFEKPVAFAAALDEFAAWYRSEHGPSPRAG
jgi:nucleoside-diphosphate-sugar epimerase